MKAKKTRPDRREADRPGKGKHVKILFYDYIRYGKDYKSKEALAWREK